jgi:hypothetical protein
MLGDDPIDTFPDVKALLPCFQFSQHVIAGIGSALQYDFPEYIH